MGKSLKLLQISNIMFIFAIIKLKMQNTWKNFEYEKDTLYYRYHTIGAIILLANNFRRR